MLAEEMIWNTQKKYVGDMNALPNIIHGKSYHMISLKESDYIMIMMTTYGMLENLEGSYMQWRYKVSIWEVVTKLFNYCEVFDNHFCYCQQVDENKNYRHCPISVESNRGKK